MKLPVFHDGEHLRSVEQQLRFDQRITRNQQQISQEPFLDLPQFVRQVHGRSAMLGHGQRIGSQPEWDFVYVADGEAHKNHRTLLAAWQLLAKEGLRPSLALTLSSRDSALKCEIANTSQLRDLQVHDLGQLPREQVMALYANARAMIFPSKSESLGLPLVEATHVGLPILAPEMDYVRDVCVPVQTFDPDSPVSIARAVKRFLGRPEPCVALRTPAEFWRELLRKGYA